METIRKISQSIPREQTCFTCIIICGRIHHNYWLSTASDYNTFTTTKYNNPECICRSTGRNSSMR